MNAKNKTDLIRAIRALVFIQVVVAFWFFLGPDTLPELARQLEMQLDLPLYAALDAVVVALVYFQTLSCAALWWPRRVTLMIFCLVTIAITALSSGGGPVILSDVDSLLGYLQTLACGGMLALLWIYLYRSLPER